MPVIYIKRIYREDLINNPNVLFLFGDNDLRKGYGGQAAEMRGEENAIGIRTKWEPSTAKKAYFSDDDYDTIVDMLDDDLEEVIEALEDGQTVVIPADGIGTGMALLEENAPMVFEYLQEKMESLRDYGVNERF